MNGLTHKIQDKDQSINFQRSSFIHGVRDILPLSIAVFPWAILAGSMAIDAGLSFAQAFAMSAVIFAGAAQLVSLGLVMSGASFLTILITIFFLTSQHFIYALDLRKDVKAFPFYKRWIIGFLLTDELFAVANSNSTKRNFSYFLGAGLSFYCAWCVFSILGIYLAQKIPDLEKLHLDFSIIAIFVLIIIPLIKSFSALLGVIASIFAAYLFRYFQIEAGLVLSGLIGMMVAKIAESLRGTAP